MFLYTPDSIEVIPEVFKRATLHKGNIIINDFELDLMGSKVLLRNIVNKSKLPNSGQIQEVSVTDLIIRLIAKTLVKFITNHSLFVFKKEDGFHLLFFSKNKLLFANTFNFTALEEVLYFCLSVMKDFNVTQDDTCLFYSETEYSSSAIDLWNQYFAHVISLEKHFDLPTFQGEIAFELREFSLLLQLIKCA